MTTEALAAPSGLVTFERWDDPEIDACRVAVDGGYSRTAWLPVLGTTSWLVWGSLATRVKADRRHRCTLGELAPPHAPGPAAVGRALSRLEAYGLAEQSRPGVWVVRRTCPPLWDRLLARAPSPVHAAHHVTFLPSRARRRARRSDR
jgi:hypothetical protein